MTRVEVYKVIEAERAYQDSKWGPTQEGGKHSLTEFLAYIQDYTNEAMHICSRTAAPECDDFARHSMRKIAALAVAALEQHGALDR
jgi:hypothetical protein